MIMSPYNAKGAKLLNYKQEHDQYGPICPSNCIKTQKIKFLKFQKTFFAFLPDPPRMPIFCILGPLSEKFRFLR